MICGDEALLKRQMVKGNPSVRSKYGSIFSLSTKYSTWTTLLLKPVIRGEKSRYVTVESEINIDNCPQWRSMSSGVKKVKLPSVCSCCSSLPLDRVQLKHWKPSFVAALQIISEDISVTSSHSYHYVRFVPAASYVGLSVYCAWLTDSSDAIKLCFIMDCDDMRSRTNLLQFRRNLLLPSSGWKREAENFSELLLFSILSTRFKWIQASAKYRSHLLDPWKLDWVCQETSIWITTLLTKKRADLNRYLLTCKLNSTIVNNKAKNKTKRKIRFLDFKIRRVLNVVCFLLGNSPTSEFYMPTFRNTLYVLRGRIGIRLWRWNRQSVPKRLHIQFRRRGIAQKKAYKKLNADDDNNNNK